MNDFENLWLNFIHLLRRNWNCRKEEKRYQSVTRWTVILLIHVFFISLLFLQGNSAWKHCGNSPSFNTVRISKTLKCFQAPLHLFFKLISLSGCSELWKRFLCFFMFKVKFRLEFSKYFLAYPFFFFPGYPWLLGITVSLKLLLWSHCLSSKNQWQRRSPRLLSESPDFSFMFTLLPNSL